MARAPRNKPKAVGDSASHRRSARGDKPKENGLVEGEEDIQNKGGVGENAKGSNKRKRPTAEVKSEFADLLPAAELRRSKRIKRDIVTECDGDVKAVRGKKTKKTKLEAEAEGRTAVKIEAHDDDDNDDDGGTTTAAHHLSSAAPAKTPAAAAAADLLGAKKLKSYAQFAAARQSPYPDFSRPTPAECKLAHRILASLHGEQTREPEEEEKERGVCGRSRSVLDALVLTVLSQNTSNVNSNRAKAAMDAVYGCGAAPAGSAEEERAWAAVVDGGQAKLAQTIASGGLAGVKSRAILDILAQTRARRGPGGGRYTLDHLFAASDDEAMRELLSFRGVGPKTASCVLLFCLGRASFTVDTHVHRITGLLGWRPREASRDQTYAHLDARIPDADKYGLHVLLVRHGRVCGECRAGGKNTGKCELRRAFRGGKMAGEAGEEVKEEEMKVVMEEEEIGQVKEEEEEDGGDVKG
ncbi:DNA glycosylase [Xylaria palmicola]|nr:DNA glycosylase [Xylaria palmicola]